MTVREATALYLAVKARTYGDDSEFAINELADAMLVLVQAACAESVERGL